MAGAGARTAVDVEAMGLFARAVVEVVGLFEVETSAGGSGDGESGGKDRFDRSKSGT
jgi:hypothetical protein